MQNVGKSVPRSMKNGEFGFKQRKSIFSNNMNISSASKSIKKINTKNEKTCSNKYGENKKRIPVIKRIPLNIIKQSIRNRSKQNFLLSPDALYQSTSKIDICLMYQNEERQQSPSNVNRSLSNLFSPDLQNAYQQNMIDFKKVKNPESSYNINSKDLLIHKNELRSLKNIITSSPAISISNQSTNSKS